MNNTAWLFHCFAEVRVRCFTIAKDECANHAELNAGQTPQDCFWSVVYWLSYYGYVWTWFHPTNKFQDTQWKVEQIDQDDLDQHRDVAYLKETLENCPRPPPIYRCNLPDTDRFP